MTVKWWHLVIGWETKITMKASADGQVTRLVLGKFGGWFFLKKEVERGECLSDIVLCVVRFTNELCKNISLLMQEEVWILEDISNEDVARGRRGVMQGAILCGVNPGQQHWERTIAG